jgi:pimeloyl-ACP methyl ester carboxylesterase
VKAPTLIIHGENDTLVPLFCARQAAEGIPGAPLHIISACGHWPQREKPDEFNRVLVTFLAEAE